MMNNRRDPEDIQMAALGANILHQLGEDNEYLPRLGEYLDLAQQTAKTAILFTVFEEILRSGYSPDELMFGLSQFSYRWGCLSATIQTVSAASELASISTGKGSADQ